MYHFILCTMLTLIWVWDGGGDFTVSQIPDTVCKTSIFINSNLLSYKT